jgi:3-deoxy-7-phosphoheptulonate synthase
MIVKFAPGAGDQDVRRLQRRLKALGLTVNVVRDDGTAFLATSGDERELPLDAVQAHAGVADVVDSPPPFFFTSRSFKEDASIVRIGDVEVGGGREPVVIAGPCAVESRTDVLETAAAVKEAGAKVFRAGLFKPRTTPYNFQGIGRRGLEILAEVRERVGLPVVTEVLDPGDIPALAAHCDALQVGTRNMTNTALLKHLGRAGKPVLLKRSFAAKIEDLVKAAEFVYVYGNPEILLCERGIQTIETYTRFTLDLAAVPAVRELSHLPIVVDPSHGTGRKSLIRTMSRAAVAAGADALMLECHVAPERMIKPGDDFQALRPHELEQIVGDVKTLAQLNADVGTD